MEDVRIAIDNLYLLQREWPRKLLDPRQPSLATDRQKIHTVVQSSKKKKKKKPRVMTCFSESCDVDMLPRVYQRRSASAHKETHLFAVGNCTFLPANRDSTGATTSEDLYTSQ